MAKSWLWCLSLLALTHRGHCQAVAPARPADQCGSRRYQDSLVTKYIARGAHQYSYNDPRWTQYCDSLLAVCPSVAYAYQQKAVPLIKDGKYAAAFALENRAAALDPRAWLAYRGFLKCIFTKDYEGAILDFQQVARLKPGSREMDHTYPFFEGLCNLELGNYQRAEANFKEDIRQQKGPGGQQDVHFNTLFYTGVVYLQMKRYAPASAYLTQCLKAYPQHPEANYYLGLTYQAQGNKATARRYFLAAQKALASGYRLNEDNIYYANYPRQITDYEIRRALRGL
ncbi:MAG: tetratricopeptide repeat protein [Hymenobacter sp.]|nr:MAG: tetratricopeptide repeat protein [Hymenobacter sp.]